MSQKKTKNKKKTKSQCGESESAKQTNKHTLSQTQLITRSTHRLPATSREQWNKQTLKTEPATLQA